MTPEEIIKAIEAEPEDDRAMIIDAAINDGFDVPKSLIDRYGRQITPDLPDPNRPFSNPIDDLRASKEFDENLVSPSFRTSKARFQAGTLKSEDPAIILPRLQEAIGKENAFLSPSGEIVLRAPDGSIERFQQDGLDIGDVMDFLGKNYGKMLGGLAAAIPGVGVLAGAGLTMLGTAGEEAVSGIQGDGRSLLDRGKSVAAEGAVDLAGAGLGRGLAAGGRWFRKELANTLAGPPSKEIVDAANGSGFVLDASEKSMGRMSNLVGTIKRMNPEAFSRNVDANLGRMRQFYERALSAYGKAPDSVSLANQVRARHDGMISAIKEGGKKADDAAYGLVDKLGGPQRIYPTEPIQMAISEMRTELTQNIAPGKRNKGMLSALKKVEALVSGNQPLTAAEYTNLRRELGQWAERPDKLFDATSQADAGRRVGLLRNAAREMEDAATDAASGLDPALAQAVKDAREGSRAWRMNLKEVQENSVSQLIGDAKNPDEIYGRLSKASPEQLKTVLHVMDEETARMAKARLITDEVQRVIPEFASPNEMAGTFAAAKRWLDSRDTIRRLDVLGIPKKETVAIRNALGTVINRNPMAGSTTALMQDSARLLSPNLSPVDLASAASNPLGAAMDFTRNTLASRWALGRGLASAIADPEGRGILVKTLEVLGREKGSGTRSGRIAVEAMRKLGAWAMNRKEFQDSQSEIENPLEGKW